MGPTSPTNPPVTATAPIDDHGFLVIVSGPSGVGKSSIVNAILPRLDADLSISMTTRDQRPGDQDGTHYHFITVDQFKQHIDDDDFLEWAQVYGNYYGTRRRFVQNHLQRGRLVILEIDVEGAKQVKAKMPEAFALFIVAPSEQALLDRLRSRKQDDEATIQRRFAEAKDEIQRARQSDVYARFVVNDVFDPAVEEVVTLIDAERQRRATPAS